MQPGGTPPPTSEVSRRTIALSIIVAAVGGVLVALTAQIREEGPLGLLYDHREQLLAIEIALTGVFGLELLGRALIDAFRRRNALDLGVALRATLRTIGYVVLGVSVVSVLSANASLAIGVGSITGVVIGISAQHLIGNVFAGMFLAVSRVVRIGDEITVLGSRGRVVEIGLVHTVLDVEDRLVFVPSTVMLTNAAQRHKPGA